MNQKLAVIFLLIITILAGAGLWFFVQNKKNPHAPKEIVSPYDRDGKIIDPVARKAELETMVNTAIEQRIIAIMLYPEGKRYSDEDYRYRDKDKKYVINDLYRKGKISAQDKKLLK